MAGLGQRLNDDVLYIAASHSDVESMLNLAKASRSLYSVISPAAIRKDLLAGNGKSIFNAIKNNDFRLLETILCSPTFDINRAYERRGKNTSILQYAVEHASARMFKILTSPVLYQAFLNFTEDHQWVNDQGGNSNLLVEATRHGRSDLITYILDSLGVLCLPTGWPAYFDPRRFWDLNNISLVSGLSGRKTALDPYTIRLLSQYSDFDTFIGVNGNPHFELKSYYPQAPYAVPHASPSRLRQWSSNPLHVAMLQRQHPEARQHVRLETIDAWLDVGVPVNQQDGGLVDHDHASPMVSYFRTPLDIAAEGLDLEGMDFLLSKGAAASVLGIDNGSLTRSARFTDVTTMSLLMGHRLWSHYAESGYSVLVPGQDILLPSGSTCEDMMLQVRQMRASLKAEAPNLMTSIHAVEAQIRTGIRMLQERLGQHRLPLVIEESTGLPLEVFCFIHDEFLESPHIADSLVKCFGSSWINEGDWNSRTPLLQLLSGIAPVEHKFWSAGNHQAWYIRQTLHKPDLVRWLLENGANPNIRDVEGMTPLRYALFRMDFEAVELLLQHGADPTEVSGLLYFVLNCSYEEALSNANAFMSHTFNLCFVGVGEGFVGRIQEQVQKWDLHRTGVLGVQVQTAGDEMEFSITVPSSPLDSGLGLFLDTHLCLGSRLRMISDEKMLEKNLIHDTDLDRWEAFGDRLKKLRYVVQSYCNYRPVPSQKRRRSSSSVDRPIKRHRAT